MRFFAKQNMTGFIVQREESCVKNPQVNHSFAWKNNNNNNIQANLI